jgi:hypothetical protein
VRAPKKHVTRNEAIMRLGAIGLSVLFSLSLFLSACGGGGGGYVSPPPPSETE